MADPKSSNSIEVTILPSRILHSQKLLTSVVKVLQEDYFSPFSRLLNVKQVIHH